MKNLVKDILDSRLLEAVLTAGAVVLFLGILNILIEVLSFILGIFFIPLICISAFLLLTWWFYGRLG